MKIEINIDDRLINAVRRAMTRRRLVVAAFALTLSGAIAIAAPIDPLPQFTANTTASASAVNANFEALRTAINDLDADVAAVSALTTINVQQCGSESCNSNQCFCWCRDGVGGVGIWGGVDCPDGSFVEENRPHPEGLGWIGHCHDADGNFTKMQGITVFCVAEGTFDLRQPEE